MLSRRLPIAFFLLSISTSALGEYRLRIGEEVIVPLSI